MKKKIIKTIDIHFIDIEGKMIPYACNLKNPISKTIMKFLANRDRPKYCEVHISNYIHEEVM